MQVRQIIIGIMLIGLPLAGYAQRPSRDNEKAKQWQSMENGPWDFAPDWYYYFLHNKYSGAEMYWKWAGFKSGFRVRFKEPKSSVKRIMPIRVTSEETQCQKVKKVEEERTHIEELYKEELLREADRNVDLTYASYKDEFNRMQGCITDGLLYCMKKSDGKLKHQVDELSRQNEILARTSPISTRRESATGWRTPSGSRHTRKSRRRWRNWWTVPPVCVRWQPHIIK